MNLDEALAHAATCTGKSKTHIAIKALAASCILRGQKIKDLQGEPVLRTKLLPPYGSCPTCLGKTIDGICGRCGL